MVGTAWGSRTVHGSYFILFYFVGMTVLPACSYVYHTHAGAFRLQKVSDTLEQMVVKHCVCADLCRLEDGCGRAGPLLPFGAGIKLRLPDLSGRCLLTGPHAFLIIIRHCLLFCVGFISTYL